MHNFKIVPLSNTKKYLIGDLDHSIFSEIKEQVNVAKQLGEKSNYKLIGHIQEEYEMPAMSESLKNFLREALIHFTEKDFITSEHLTYERLWVNFQKKTEFNPLHIHTSNFSYVIWIKIPFLSKDEHVLYNGSIRPQTGDFVFATVDNENDMIYTHNIPADSTFEGKIIFFDSSTSHMVHPFYTSDEYRISVAGNINYTEEYYYKIMPDAVKPYFGRTD
jgi:Putative 2OG-Fe(II) oxygenase